MTAREPSCAPFTLHRPAARGAAPHDGGKRGYRVSYSQCWVGYKLLIHNWRHSEQSEELRGGLRAAAAAATGVAVRRRVVPVVQRTPQGRLVQQVLLQQRLREVGGGGRRHRAAPIGCLRAAILAAQGGQLSQQRPARGRPAGAELVGGSICSCGAAFLWRFGIPSICKSSPSSQLRTCRATAASARGQPARPARQAARAVAKPTQLEPPALDESWLAPAAGWAAVPARLRSRAAGAAVLLLLLLLPRRAQAPSRAHG